MQQLIKSAKIIDPNSIHHGKKRDILISNGIITRIAARIDPGSRVKQIKFDNLHISPGWMEVQANFCDPGFEHREDLQSGLQLASAGGFTAVGILPNTNPPIDNKSQINYILSNSLNGIIDLFPIGSVSKQLKGKSLTEMLEMNDAGALAFSHGLESIDSSELLMRSLQYVKPFNGTIIDFPEDKTISGNGIINEGKYSVLLGMKGKPAMSEEIRVQRNIQLAKYSGSHLHFSQISTEKSVQLIEEAKSQGIKITASVNPLHLIFDDSVLIEFDTNFKINPPLRGIKDKRALLKGLKNGTIDCLSSFHNPHHQDDKKKEFNNAADGVSGLQTVFPSIITHLKNKINLKRLIEILSTAPRRIFNLPIPKVEKNTPANLTLFIPDLVWTYNKTNIKGKSYNNPFWGTELKGKVVGIINNNQYQGL